MTGRVETQTIGSSLSVVERTSPLVFLLDLLDLTKPKIMFLLLISTGCPMILASGGSVSWMSLFMVLLGGALVSGSASAMNCIYDRDIDAVMERTKNRPLAAGRISVITAYVFSSILAISGLLLLAIYFNTYAAAIALFGHIFYVLVYTVWLKRSTPQNIVIGGAAGAIPPLVGWAAVTGNLDLTAVLLFLIIFLWTPPHFWALALNKNSDYKRAGVPMLPVVAGETVTHNQMLWYALALMPVSVWLVFSSEYLGWCSLVVLLLLSALFAFKVFQLKLLSNSDSELKMKKAWDVFGFSVIYLMLFFICIVLDATVV